MTSIIFERISWLFSSFTGFLSKRRFGEVLYRLGSRSGARCDSDHLKSTIRVEQLPDDCIFEIFRFLQQEDLLKCRRVCRRWKAVADGNKALWHTAQFGSFSAAESTKHRVRVNFPSSITRKCSSESQLRNGRHPDIVTYLNNRDILAKQLVVNLSPSETSIFQPLKRFFASRLHKRVKSVHVYCIMTKTTNSECEREERSITNVLEYLSTHCTKIKVLDLDLAWNAVNVRLISKLKQLTALEIHSCPYVQHVSRWHLDEIMTLPHLQRLKIVNTGIPKVSEKFEIASASLLVLDVSDCVNFLIVSMNCPKLEEFIAHNVKYYRTIYYSYPPPCVKKILLSSCPNLKQVNGVAVSDQVQLERCMNFCCCNMCGPWSSKND